MSLSVVAFLFVMLHAQTIKGDRYAQMSNRDTLLASLILFHEFLIVYTLTFYWQINYAYFTPEEYSLLTESSKQESIRLNYADYGDETDNEPAPAEISEANVDANGPSERTIVFAPVIEARVGDAEAWNGTGTHRENGNAITDSTDKSPKIPLNVVVRQRDAGTD
ncbi:uncharacterized protein LOC111078124 isoform X2 [Drosophila obscura]|nr:uncharacterized protein LOC111078124 isoform X2 [Drosophila obscura]